MKCLLLHVELLTLISYDLDYVKFRHQQHIDLAHSHNVFVV